MNNMYAYVRVSTKDQNENRQAIAMREQGIPQKTSSLKSGQARITTSLFPEYSSNYSFHHWVGLEDVEILNRCAVKYKWFAVHLLVWCFFRHSA